MQAAIYGLGALRALEQRAQQSGIDLMQRAGQAIADWVAARLPLGASILLAAGPGNNGGDALIAATLLHQAGFNTEVLLPEAPKSTEALRALRSWQATAAKTWGTLPAHFPRPDLVIDGLFGIGIERPFSPAWCQVIERLNRLGAPILALDTPSGLDAYRGSRRNAAIAASATLTFLCHKPGLYTGEGSDLAGTVWLATLDHPGWSGTEPDGALNRPSARRLQRRNNSHKGSYGTVSIVGGAPGMLGAALLAAKAALTNGAGKVFVCALDTRLPLDPTHPELMIHSADDWQTGSVLAIGPGLGQSPEAHALLCTAVQHDGPLLLDADALNLLARDPTLTEALAQRSEPAIMTPHPAEAARLLDSDTAEVQADRLAAAQLLARRFNCVVVLKGAGSLIVNPDGYYHLNTSGGPALASAGQGDVLSGLCAALLAQGLDGFEAASLAVLVHGQAADDYTLAQGGPIGLSASDTAIACARVLNRMLSALAITKKSNLRL